MMSSGVPSISVLGTCPKCVIDYKVLLEVPLENRRSSGGYVGYVGSLNNKERLVARHRQP